MCMRKCGTILVARKVSLQGYEFSRLFQSASMIREGVIHIPKDRTYCSTDTAGDDCTIDFEFICKFTKRGMNFLTRFENNHNIIVTTRPFHD